MKTFNYLIITLFVSSCAFTEEIEPTSPDLSSPDNWVIPSEFKFETQRGRAIAVVSKDNRGNILPNVAFEISWVHNGQREVVQGSSTGQSGEAKLAMQIPNHIDSIAINTTHAGMPLERMITVSDGMRVELGGIVGTPFEGKIAKPSLSAASRTLATSYTYMEDYDNYGKPYNLEPVDDHIFQDILDLVNSSLPEQFPVPIYNPQYLSDSLEADVLLRDTADIWITFVHEGAGWRNALGYYTYDMNNPPTSVEEIDELNIIFPNCSYKNSGGNLASGNKVHLGKYPPNTGVGWFLVPNGWNGSNVSWRSDIKFSNKDFNIFTNAENRQHIVTLKDDTRRILLLGMEDTSRPSGDQDFNDAVFYITANPYSALISDQFETTQISGPDADGDGILDNNDAYPDDPNKAFDVFTPSKDVFGSLAFEDMWPVKGDYDMNDLVINYNYQFVANASMEIKEILGTFKLRALGATIASGFGFEIPIEQSKIKSVTGTDVQIGGEVILNSNGTEAGQTEAVIILFENGFRVWGQYSHINTIEDAGYIDPIEFNVRIELEASTPLSELGYAPFNAFIFHSNNRGNEIHLSTGAPTDLMEMTLLQSGDDNSSDDKYFVTSNNMPWAFSLPIEFDYPEEYYPINDAFLHFQTWATSGGRQYDNWYENMVSYRNTSKVYQKP